MKKIIFDVDGGITIYHDNDENLVRLIAASVFVDQEYKEGYEAIKNRKNPVILDIGAHIGMASIYFSKIKGARIFAFEPCKKNYKYLVKNTKRLKNIKTFNYGISAFNSENREFGLETLYFKQQGKPPLEVIKTRNFQWILDTLKLDHIDLIKIDTEGAEYEIFFTTPFKGNAHKVDYIVGESHWGVGPFAPQDLVPFFEELKWDFKFLPIKNYTRGWIVEFVGEIGDAYKVTLKYNTPTLFFANINKI